MILTSLALCLLLSACTGVSAEETPPATIIHTQNPGTAIVLPAGQVGVAYSTTVSGGQPPYHFAIASGQLPPGLTLGSTTGTLSGTPTQSGTFTFTILRVDGNSFAAEQPFQMTVTNPPPPVTVSVSPTTATVASGGTQQFTALVSNTSQVAVTWSAQLGTISNTGLYIAPTVTTKTTDVVTATSVAYPAKSASATVTVTAPVLTPPLTITTTSLPSANQNSSYSSSFSASGGKPPYSWSLTSGSLPSGISLQSSGLLSGTPTQSGQFNFSVEVTDSSSPLKSASSSFTLTVSSSSGGGAGGGNGQPPATFLGFSESDTNGGSWPSVTYQMQRFWDSPPDQWPSINTAAGQYDFSGLDSDLALAYSQGAMIAMYTLARTPPWATSNPNDTSCNYTTGIGGGNGECDPPYDLNSDGSGTNATWKAWITAIATHANSPAYLQTHAHIKYWEIWNEPDTQAFWNGTIAQLARLTEDANCIITGRGVIHENGNGTATPCTAAAIDPTAQIVMASAHAKGAALAYGQNELYCNDSPRPYQLPCPNPPNAIASAVDIINFHMKPGMESGNNCPKPTPCTVESAMQMYVSNIHGILEPAEQAKPLWDGEAQYSESGFTGAYADPDMAASFMPRFYLIDWTLGLQGIAWYYATSQAEPAAAQTSYQQTYNWLSDATLTTPCAANGTVWTCEITKSGTTYAIMWDTSQSCSNGTCTTQNQPVSSQWRQYQDMTTASSPVNVSGGTVPVGIKPIVLQ